MRLLPTLLIIAVAAVALAPTAAASPCWFCDVPWVPRYTTSWLNDCDTQVWNQYCYSGEFLCREYQDTQDIVFEPEAGIQDPMDPSPYNDHYCEYRAEDDDVHYTLYQAVVWDVVAYEYAVIDQVNEFVTELPA